MKMLANEAARHHRAISRTFVDEPICPGADLPHHDAYGNRLCKCRQAYEKLGAGAAMGFDWLTSLGPEIQLDTSKYTWLTTRWLLLVRYKFGDSMQGWSIGSFAVFNVQGTV